MISTIIFDLGGVLFTNGAGRFLKYLATHYHYPESALDEMINGKSGSAYRSGGISSEEFWTSFKASFPIPKSAQELEALWESQYELVSGTRDLILDLRKTYKVYYLSDTVQKRVQYLERMYNFLSWFDGGVFSYEVGVRKPNPEVYKKVLALAGVLGPQAVFIDDKEHFLEPAKALGMRTIHFKDALQVKKDLATLLR